MIVELAGALDVGNECRCLSSLPCSRCAAALGCVDMCETSIIKASVCVCLCVHMCAECISIACLVLFCCSVVISTHPTTDTIPPARGILLPKNNANNYFNHTTHAIIAIHAVNVAECTTEKFPLVPVLCGTTLELRAINTNKVHYHNDPDQQSGYEY